MDKKYVMTGLSYALVGILLGIYMAKSHDYGQKVTHAHILLVGFVVSFIYGVCHKLWLHAPAKLWSGIQFICHQAGTAIMVVGLFLLYGGLVSEDLLGPILGIASLAVLAGLIIMTVLVARSGK